MGAKFWLCPTTLRIDVYRGQTGRNFINGFEDTDYCLRAHTLGFQCIQNQRSFVFHFGGKSTYDSNSLSPQTHPRTQEYFNHRDKHQRTNEACFREKWGNTAADKFLSQSLVAFDDTASPDQAAEILHGYLTKENLMGTMPSQLGLK